MKRILLTALTASMLLAHGSAGAQGTKAVTSGFVIRGLTVGGGGTTGTPIGNGRTCDFSRDPVSQTGHLEGSSVNCAPNGTLQGTMFGLAANFTAYCAMKAPVRGARLIQAPLPDNPNHCDLSGITPKDATQQFKGAYWK